MSEEEAVQRRALFCGRTGLAAATTRDPAAPQRAAAIRVLREEGLFALVSRAVGADRLRECGLNEDEITAFFEGQ